TGLSAQGVDELNRSLSQIDTRTSKKDLRDIAIGLGQIGEAANVDNIRAINTVVVALGDEFGGSAQEITNAVSILRNNLTDFKTDNYADDILKIGNALNVLGATGLATAPVVTDFATRMSGVLQGFGVSTAQTLGLSAAMQELGIGVERGATAVTKLVQKMSQNPEVFAKVAGAKTKKEIQDFIELLNNDAVAALLKVAQGAKSAGNSNVQFAGILKELESTGAGVGEVLSKFAANTDLVTKRVDASSEALQNANSINQEFALLNENTAAKIEKLKKSFTALTESDTFNRFLTAGINNLIAFVKWVKEAGAWINNNIFIFKAIGVSILTYVAAVRLATIWQARKIALDKIESVGVRVVVAAIKAAILVQELYTKEITFAEFRQRILNRTMLLNPYVAVAAAIVGATVAINGFIKKQREAAIAFAKNTIVLRYDSDMKKINDQMKTDLDYLKTNLEKFSKDELKANIKSGLLVAEDNKEAVRQQGESYKKLVKDAEEQKKKLADLDNSFTLESTYQKERKKLEVLNTERDKAKEKLFVLSSATQEYASVVVQMSEKLKQTQDGEIEKQKELSEVQKREQEKQLEQQKKFNDELRKLLNDVERAKIEAIEEEDARELLFLQKDKEDKEAQINQEIDAQKQLAIELGKGTTVLKKLEEDRGFLLLGVREKYERDRKALIEKQTKEKNEDAYKKEIDAVTQRFEAEKLLEKQLYAEGLSTKEKFDFQLQDLDRQSKVELLEITRKYGKNENDLQQAIADIDIKIAEDRSERMKRALLNEAEVRARYASLNVNANNTNRFDALREQYDAETNLLVTKLATEAGITELNEQTIFDIKKQYADQFAEIDQQYSQERQNTIMSLVDASITAFSGFFDAIMQGLQQNIQAQQDLLQQQTDAELALLEDKKNKRLIYEDEYAIKKDEINKKSAAKERELKRKAAIQDKVATIFHIGLSTAQAVMNALASVPFPANIAFATLAGITGAIQLGFAAAKPIPYAKGGKFLGDVLDGPTHANGGMPVLNPATGQVVAELEGGEPVLSKKTYENNKPIVDALLYTSQYENGKKIKMPAYFNPVSTFAYGGVISAYQTTSLARGGFVASDDTARKRAKRDGRNPATGARTVEDFMAMQTALIEKLNKRLEEPLYGVWDFDYFTKSNAIIDKSKKIGNVG
ncbi:MAG TPA: hypothetical protein PLS10_08575, partial [Chitinophagales bacterium]|nr:hypothetical protein [Chitinophagales bacterium]